MQSANFAFAFSDQVRFVALIDHDGRRPRFVVSTEAG